MTYLVVRLSTLGSIAMLVPVMASVAATHSNDHFVVVSNVDFADVFAHIPNVDYKKISGAMSYFSLVKKMQACYKFDALIDLQDSKESRLLRTIFNIFGVPNYVIKKDRHKRDRLIKLGYKLSEPLKSEFTLYLNTFAAAGLTIDDVKFTPLQPQIDEVTRQIIGEKPNGQQWIGVAPFATHATNMLPYKVTKGLLAYLNERPNTRVFLFGAGEIECEMLGQWASVFDNVTTVAGRVSIMNELAIMTQLDIMIGMDSANQHLSSLVGLPALTIWCGTHPNAGFYGWKQNPDFIVQKDLDCRPCTLHGGEKCKLKKFECKRIDTDEIIAKLEWCLKKII